MLVAAIAAAVPPKNIRSAKRLSAATGSSPLLRGFSLHDEIAQLFIVRGYGDFPATDSAEYKRFLRWIRDDRVGGFIVAGHIRNGDVIPAQPFEMATFINRMQHYARTPLLVASDFERGASSRVADTAKYPYMMAFGAAGDQDAVRKLGAATASEARALGVTWVFAPDADVNNNPANPIINTRSFGENPQAVAADVAAFIDGAHADAKHYVLVTTKHFPGHGDTAQDSHMQLAVINEPKERIESLELVPFRAAIAHQVDAIMTAHLSVPSFEPTGLPATLSHNILTGLLRDELGFKGLIVTDALDMQGVASLFTQGEAAVRALEAGADVLLMPIDPEPCIRAIEQAVHSGRLTRQRIDESAAKILKAKHRVGLYQTRFVNLDQLTDRLDRAHTEPEAQATADRAFTIVKDDRHLFPMPAGPGTCLVVINDNTFSHQGGTVARELRRSAPQTDVYEVNTGTPESLLIAIASDTAHCKQIYAVAFATVEANRGTVGLEGGLNGFLTRLSHAPAPLALISMGNPYLLQNFPAITSYAAAFSTTETSERAAAKAIAGLMDVRGHLPVSIPGFAKIGDGLAVSGRSNSASNQTQ